MSIVVINKRHKKQIAQLEKEGALLIDVTASSDSETFRKFDPSYPHGDIPVPSLCKDEAIFAMSVEGIWQGLKVFQCQGIDASKFRVRTMKGIRRCANDTRGALLGHVLYASEEVLSAQQAHEAIFVTAYKHVLETRLQNELLLLKGLVDEGHTVVLLDMDDSHASLIARSVA